MKIDKNERMKMLMKHLYLRSYRRGSTSIYLRAYSKEFSLLDSTGDFSLSASEPDPHVLFLIAL